MSDLHSDFLAAPDEQQWAGPLDALFDKLLAEAYAARGARWVQRVLPRGAIVQMRIRPEDFRPQLRLCRRDGPLTDTGLEAWSRECATFLRVAVIVSIARWQQDGEDVRRGSGIARSYLAVRPGEPDSGPNLELPLTEAAEREAIQAEGA